MPNVFAPPEGSRAGPAETYYQVFAGPGTAFESAAGVAANDFPGGRKDTFLVVEGAEPVPWTKPANIPYDPGGPFPKLGGLFPDGFHAAYADGAVRFVSRRVDVPMLRSLVTRTADGTSADRDKLP